MARSRDHQRVPTLCRAPARRLEAIVKAGEGIVITHEGVYPLPGCITVTRDEVVELRAEVAALTELCAVLWLALWLAQEAR